MTLDERIEFLHQSIESHDRQIGENTQHIAELKESIAALVNVTNQDATAIRTLARLADVHEHRLSNLEGQA